MLFSFAKKVVETVADGALSLVQSEVIRYRSIKDDFERLKGTSEAIKALLADAEEHSYIEDNAIKLYLRDLKSVSLEADNLLDEYQSAIEVYEHNSSFTGSPRKRKWYQMELSSITPEWGLARRRRFASEIDKINKRLEEIAKRRKILRLRGEDGQRREYHAEIDKINQKLEDIARDHQIMMMRFKDSMRQEWPHSSAQILYSSSLCSDQMTIVGRQNEINDLVDLLMSDFGRGDSSRPMVPVVPIHGEAGIGKTVLAKMVFNDKRICVYFDFKAWVTLTDMCDMRAASKEIYRKMTGQRCSSTDADMLQKLGYKSCSLH